MRKVYLLLCALLFSVQGLFAQRELKNPLINSKEVITKALALHQEKKYKEAVAEYLKVPASDTNYATVLHELILSYYTDSNYVEAEKYSHIGLSMFPEERSKWYGFLANVYDDTERSDLALSTYDSILVQNPNNYLVWFNKGITLFRQEKYDAAAADFIKCALINPYYASAHYYLGKLAMLKGNFVPATLSFATALTISPESPYQAYIINYLKTIAEVNNSANEFLQKYKAGKEDNFDDVHDILISKVALNKNYKLKADLEDQIVRQLQVVIEKIEYNANDKGFWMQYYVPLFKKLWDDGQFEPLVFTMFSGLDIKKVKEYNSKEKKKISQFINNTTNYLSEIRESQELVLAKREGLNNRYYIKDSYVTGKGNYTKNSKGELEVIGPWEFYYENGVKKSKGSFGENTSRRGDWYFYYSDGTVSEVTKYVDNKAHGKSEVWSENGLLYRKVNFLDDEKDGEETNYYYSGRLASVINYRAGKKNGVAKYYNKDGFLRSVVNYVNDEQDGMETAYYENGKVESVVSYTKNIANGEYKEYYDNGDLKIKGMITDGKKSGPWNHYFKGNKPELQETYIKGELDGEAVSYYENGKVASKKVYKKGDLEGKQENFDDDGIVYSETIFEKGRLRDIKFFDKKGNVISNTTSRKGNANVSFYGPDGNLSSEGYYTKEGQAEGDFNYYYKNGTISATATYKKGYAEGKKTFYYANKKLKQEGTYKMDKADGYFVDYYINGQVSREGWYVDDNQQGTFISYDLLGKLTNKQYYLYDQVNGVSEFYTPDGRIDNKQYYKNGWFYKIEQFDSTGKILSTSVLDKGEGKVKFIFPNGKTYFESSYKYYQLHGPYTVMNGDGSKKSISFYKNGARDSIYTAWHPNGKVQLEGKYKDGKKTGVWKYYSSEGKLTETEPYTEGQLDGKNGEYNEDGSVRAEYNFKKGNLDGEIKHFGESNQLSHILYYKDDEVIGYSYEDKAGKLLPMIPIKKGTGTIECFYKNGQKSARMNFVVSALDGELTMYYSNGKPKLQMSYVNGWYNGSYKSYYPSGKIKKDNNYYFGSDHGSFKYYNEDGSLISELNFYLDEPHGESKYYTAGKLSGTYIYRYGLLQSKK